MHKCDYCRIASSSTNNHQHRIFYSCLYSSHTIPKQSKGNITNLGNALSFTCLIVDLLVSLSRRYSGKHAYRLRFCSHTDRSSNIVVVVPIIDHEIAALHVIDRNVIHGCPESGSF